MLRHMSPVDRGGIGREGETRNIEKREEREATNTEMRTLQHSHQFSFQRVALLSKLVLWWLCLQLLFLRLPCKTGATLSFAIGLPVDTMTQKVWTVSPEWLLSRNCTLNCHMDYPHIVVM